MTTETATNVVMLKAHGGNEELACKSASQLTQEEKAAAEKAKERANKLFKETHFKAAIEGYDEAIRLNPYVAAYYANRAFAHFKMEAYGYAVNDAERAIELDSNYVKGYYRRAVSNMALMNFKEALRDFRTVVKRSPGDGDAQQKLKACEALVRRLEFEKAIAVDEDQRSVADTLDLSTIPVEDSYDGVRLDADGTITEEFVNDMIEKFRKQGKIHKRYAFQILLRCKEVFKAMPSLVRVIIPEGKALTICGDVHGQFYDFLNIFEINGRPSPNHIYLFNGDFVDRGSFAVEIALTLFAYKLLYPESIYMTRGNHETDSMNKVYGFEGEVKAKFSELLFKLFSETFNVLPLAHVVGQKKRILVVHGGLFSRDDVTIEELEKIDRFRQPGTSGLMCELLWSDPQDQPGRGPSKRGVGIQFGPDVTKAFLEKNGIDLLVRSHEVQENGYAIAHDGKCITVFSAPNYCDSIGNKGAFINVGPDMNLTYRVFEAVPHPNVPPMKYASSFAGMF